MARQYFVNGNTMVSANGSELGLATDRITITITPKFLDIQVSTFGPEVPPEIQSMLAEASISMTLVHFDVAVLNNCILRSMNASSAGIMSAAGALMGGNSLFTSLGISSPVGQLPWTFPSAMIVNSPQWPLGNEKSIVQVTWRAIPYIADPATAAGAVLYTNS